MKKLRSYNISLMSIDYRRWDNLPLCQGGKGCPGTQDVSLNFGRRIAVILKERVRKKFARHLNGLLLPGRAILWAVRCEERANLGLIRQRVGWFPQPEDQIVATTVEEDVAFGPENIALPRTRYAARRCVYRRVAGGAPPAPSAPALGGQVTAGPGQCAARPRCVVVMRLQPC
jgi:hypothetical protein